MLADAPQELRRELLLAEEADPPGSAIVTGRIMGGPGEPSRPRAVRDGSRRLACGEHLELAEPTGDHRPQRAVRRDAEKTVALSQLAVLVAPTDDERSGELLLAKRERHDVERVVGVHQQLRTNLLAGIEYLAEARDNVGVPVQDRRNEHRCGATVGGLGKSLGERGRRQGGDFHDAGPFLGPAVELAAGGGKTFRGPVPAGGRRPRGG